MIDPLLTSCSLELINDSAPIVSTDRKAFFAPQSESSLRMVEAITWCAACGLEEFGPCYTQTLTGNNQTVVENRDLGRGIVAWMEKQDRSTGIMQDLQKTLEESGYNLPMRANELSNHLKEIEPALRTGHGIAVKHLKRGDHGRRIEISKASSGSSSTEGER